MDSIYSETTKSIGLIAGVNYWKTPFLEIGFGKAKYGVSWGHWFFGTINFGSEISYWDNQFVVAPKISTWANGGSSAMAMGLSLIQYTNFEENTLRFRPEIGIGFDKFKCVYGYNFSIYNKEFAIWPNPDIIHASRK